MHVKRFDLSKSLNSTYLKILVNTEFVWIGRAPLASMKPGWHHMGI